MLYTNWHLQKLYTGFCKTPNLWKGNSIRKLNQFEINDFSAIFNRKQERKLRLGQLAEQFVFNQIESATNLELLAENIQIQNQRLTVGELDAIIKMNSKPLHLEIVYKFFLYDDTVSHYGLDNWIGPNRRDSLVEKLDKLSEKQLPLLYSEFTTPYLKTLQLDIEEIKQQVIFKAQLFTPHEKKIDFKHLSPEAQYGSYYRLLELEKLQSRCPGSKFFIPSKIDWFLKPEVQVEWLNFNRFYRKALTFLAEKRAFMFWMKRANGQLSKDFLVWW